MNNGSRLFIGWSVLLVGIIISGYGYFSELSKIVNLILGVIVVISGIYLLLNK